MALFKISKGLKANLPSEKTAGHCWYTIDDSLFYIDYKDDKGEIQRKALNAKEAEKISGASLATILNNSNLEIPTSSAVFAALSNKADKTHSHDDKYYTEAEIDAKLQSKSDTSHKHDDAYDKKGAAAAVSDALEDHTENSDIHVTTGNKTNWNAAYTHSQAAHAPSNAEKNQNAFSNIAVNGQTTVAADTATDTVTFAGSNVTITTDANNDKVTFSVANGSTSAKGVVQLTDSTSSTSTTTAATPNSVKSAYDFAKSVSDELKDKSKDDFGIYVQDAEPTSAVAGDVWVDTANDPAFIVPNLPEVTSADNGKVLMVVNGRWQAVTLNMTIDANGVISI